MSKFRTLVVGAMLAYGMYQGLQASQRNQLSDLQASSSVELEQMQEEVQRQFNATVK